MYYNVDDLENNAKQAMSKGYIFYDSTFMKCPE